MVYRDLLPRRRFRGAMGHGPRVLVAALGGVGFSLFGLEPM